MPWRIEGCGLAPPLETLRSMSCKPPGSYSRWKCFSWKRAWEAVVGVLLLIGLTARQVEGEVRYWRIGTEGLSWESQKLNATAISFGTSGMIQLVSFNSRQNIFPQLQWVDEFPSGYIAEQPQARIWDNISLKQPNIPIVDGNDTTSTGDRFKRFGVSQQGTSIFFDLGTQFPANKIAFFPRQNGQDDQGRPYKDDFIRGYDIFVNDGRIFNQEDSPIYSLLKRETFTSENNTEIPFPLQFVRYIRLEITSANPFEIAEFQLFGNGFAPRGVYRSKVVDLGETANFSRLGWVLEMLRQEADSLAVVPRAEAGVSVRMRTGADSTALVYYKYTNLFTGERVEVPESEYNKMDEQLRGPVEEDQLNWSPWSSPFPISDQQIDLPSPRRYFQFEIAMESRAILDGVRVKSLTVEHSIPPLAQQLIGEISQIDTPRPLGNVPIVPAGVKSTFAYDVIADVGGMDVGFDALRIFTPGKPRFVEFLLGSPPVSATPDSIEETLGSLTVFFPSRRVESRATGTLRAVFETEIFVQGTFFPAEAFDTQGRDLPQRVLPGDANPEVSTNALRVLTSAESTRDLLPAFAITPQVISPNQDGVNDQTSISYTLVQLVRPIEVKVSIYDLAGRSVRRLFSEAEGSGSYDWRWDGRGDDQKLLPVGIYLVRLEAKTEQGSFVRTGSIGVVY
ncbi:MAG: gliding motility-associated C-terminal domain-containing protein [Candidatus Latescibacteria bacterium]|nr:gliding motility-associated C-terminal domain-containing protein [Candidatus Latescibacterota bacterium]